MGVIAATPGSANAVQAPQDLGTNATSLVPAAPVIPGFAVSVRRQTPTTTTLTSSLNPSNQGQLVTFTATVAATGSAILPIPGSIIFRNGTTILGTIALDAAARATLTVSNLIGGTQGVSNLTGGTHSITAEYVPGDATAFSTSTSTTLIQTVMTAVKTPTAQKSKHDDHDDHADHSDHSDVQDLGDLCRRFKDGDFDGEDGSFKQDPQWKNLHRRCSKFHNENNDWITLVNQGIRRHVEGHYDKNGHGSWEHKHWAPYKKPYKKPYQKPYQKPAAKPVHRHFAVTG